MAEVVDGVARQEDIVALVGRYPGIRQRCQHLAGTGVFRAIEALVHHPCRLKPHLLNPRRLHRQGKGAHHIQRDGLLVEAVHRQQQIIHAGVRQGLRHLADALFIPGEKAVGDQLALGNPTFLRCTVDGAGGLRVQQRFPAEGHHGLHIKHVRQLANRADSGFLRDAGTLGMGHHFSRRAVLAASGAALRQDEFKTVDVKIRVHMGSLLILLGLVYHASQAA